ncbi:autotransporter domain-containing protein [Martelella limonii]|uniref:autotransporter domain-containing protein n=1 Tax=Martelella limonii TaxID=1647649 RepID=UPI001580BA12|nr:autotransporter domain-containing protein [Martelella limonii]
MLAAPSLLHRRSVLSEVPSGRRSSLHGLLAGTAFSGALVLGAGFYLWGGGALAACGYVQQDQTYTFSGLDCTQDIPEPAALYTDRDPVTFIFNQGSNVTLTDGPFYIGSPGSAAGLGPLDRANMNVTVSDASTVLTMGEGVDVFVGLAGANFAGAGYINVTSGARAVFNDVAVASGTQTYVDRRGKSYANVGLKIDGGAVASAASFHLLNTAGAIVAGAGSRFTLEDLLIDGGGNVFVDGGGTVTVTNTATVGKGAVAVKGELVSETQALVVGSGVNNAAMLVLADGGLLQTTLDARTTVLLGVDGGQGRLVIGDPNNLGNPRYAPGNLSALTQVFTDAGSSVDVNHTATMKDNFQLNLTSPGDGPEGLTVNHYAGFTTIQSVGNSGNPQDSNVNIFGGTLVHPLGFLGNVNVAGGSYVAYDQVGSINLTSGSVSINAPQSVSGGSAALLPYVTVEGDFVSQSGSNTYLYFADNDPNTVPISKVGGNLDLEGTVTIYYGGANAPGDYVLIGDYGNLVAEFGMVVVLDTTNGNQPIPKPSYRIDYQYNGGHTVALLFFGEAPDQDYVYWSPSSATAPAGGAGGTGTWDTESDNWTIASGGDNHGPWWNGGQTAYFANGQGTVTVDGASGIIVDGIEVSSGPYLFTGGGLKLGGTDGGATISVHSATAEFNLSIGQSNGTARLTKTGDGTLILSGDNSYGGGTDIQQGTLQIGSASGNGSVKEAITGAGALTLYTDTSVDFGNNINSFTGSFQLASNGSGIISLTGANGMYAGTTGNAQGAAIMNVIGSHGGTVAIDGGMTLAGTGTVGSAGATVTIGATSSGALMPGDYRTGEDARGTLTIGGDLVLTSGAAGATTQLQIGDLETDLVVVTGALTIGGDLIVDFSGAGYGEDNPYTLMTYASLAGGGFMDIKIYDVNAGSQRLGDEDYQLIDNYNNTNTMVLFVKDQMPEQDFYWNGDSSTPTPLGLGGSGTWSVPGTTNLLNWTTQSGTIVGPWRNGKTAIFATAAGTVTVDGAGAPAMQVAGMTFAVSGYELTYKTSAEADALMLVPDEDDKNPVIAVNSGTAEIGVSLAGAVDVTKAGSGTLILTADNSYTGVTTISGGTLQLGNSAAMLNGTLAGDIAFGGISGLALTIDIYNDTTFANVLSGPAGSFNIGGSGSLAFTGDTSDFEGDVWIYGDASVALTGTLASDELTVGIDRNGGSEGNTALVLTGSGRANIGSPSTGAMTLQTVGDGSATLAFGAGSADLPAEPGSTWARTIVMSGAATNIVFNHTATDLSLFDVKAKITSVRDGDGVILQKAGYTHMSGSLSSFEGTVNITGGTLHLLNSTLGGHTVVFGGSGLDDPAYGTLSGSGYVSGSGPIALTVKPYGALENGPHETLEVDGPAVLENNARLIVRLDSADEETLNPFAYPLFDMREIVTDSTSVIHVDVRPIGGQVLANGSYLLMMYRYWDNAANERFSLVQQDKGYSINVITNSGLVYLDVDSTETGRPYWNPGEGTQVSGFGGSGTWTMLAGNQAWSDEDGGNNGLWRQGATPIFSGQPGTVSVDISSGAITVGGLVFETDTTLAAADATRDALVLDDAATYVTAAVADGITATVALPLSGATGLLKAGQGTLVMTAANTFDGGTSVSAGTLMLADSATGGTAGSLAGTVTIAAGATLSVDTAGTLVFGAANQILATAPTAAFHIAGGTVHIDSDSSRFSGSTTVDGTLQGKGTLGGTTTVNGTLAGTVANATPLTLANLTLAAAATLAVELAATPNADPLISVSQFTPEGSNVLINVLGGGDPNTALANGDYLLVATAASMSGTPNLQLDASITNPDYQLQYLMKGLYLTVDDGTPDLYWDPAQRDWTADPNDIDWSGANGLRHSAWRDGAIAHFTGAPDVIAVHSPAAGRPSSRIRFGGLVFTADGYVLTDGGHDDVLEIAGANADITVEGAATATIDLPVAGSGQLTKRASGTLLLTAANTYEGGTDVREGRLQIAGDGALHGAGAIHIAPSATFSWAANDATLSGPISGRGTFVKEMTGSVLTLSGDSSAFAGRFSLLSGTLAMSGRMGGSVEVASGATITGTGTFGDVMLEDGATFIVGDGASLSSVSRVKSLTTSPTSVIATVVDLAQGAASTIVADGDVTLDGAVIRFPYRPGARKGDSVTLIDSLNGRIVENAEIAIEPGGGLLTYDSKVVNGNELVLFVASTLMEARCGDLSLTGNACGTMEAVQTLPPASPLFEVVEAAETDDLEDGLSSLSGDAYASMSGAMVANSHYLRDATGRHVRGALGGIAGGETISAVSNYAAETPVLTPFGAFVEENSGIGVWATGYGSWSRIKGEGGSATITDSAGGFYLGADFAAFDTMRFGAVVGYGQSSYEVDARNVTGRSDDFTLGFYGGGQWGGFGSDFGMAYTWHDVTADREIDFSTLSERERGSYNAGTFQVYGDLGYTFAITDSFQIEPYVDASYIHQQSGSFTEAGGVAALFHPESEMDTWFTTVGVRSAWEFRLGEYQSRLTAAAGWRAGFGDLNPAEQVAFDGGDVFGITGAPLAKNQGIVSVGFETQFTDKVSVGLNYTGQFGGGNESQNVSARLNIRF